MQYNTGNNTVFFSVCSKQTLTSVLLTIILIIDNIYLTQHTTPMCSLQMVMLIDLLIVRVLLLLILQIVEKYIHTIYRKANMIVKAGGLVVKLNKKLNGTT